MEPAVQRRGDLRRRRGAAARRPGRSSPAGPRPHGSPGRLRVRTTIRQETTMTASATAPTREKAERARENSEYVRSEEHTSELQSQSNLVCRLLLEKKKDE